MSTCKTPASAHVRIYKLDVEEVSKIIDRECALSISELEEMGHEEVLLASDSLSLKPFEPSGIPMPSAIGDLVFPGFIPANPFFCFCSSYRWCLEFDDNGRLRYVLKCVYWCIPRFRFAA